MRLVERRENGRLAGGRGGRGMLLFCKAVDAESFKRRMQREKTILIGSNRYLAVLNVFLGIVNIVDATRERQPRMRHYKPTGRQGLAETNLYTATCHHKPGWGLGFGFWGVGFGVWSLGFGVWGVGFRVQGSGSRVSSSGFRVWAPCVSSQTWRASGVSQCEHRVLDGPASGLKGSKGGPYRCCHPCT